MFSKMFSLPWDVVLGFWNSKLFFLLHLFLPALGEGEKESDGAAYLGCYIMHFIKNCVCEGVDFHQDHNSVSVSF